MKKRLLLILLLCPCLVSFFTDAKAFGVWENDSALVSYLVEHEHFTYYETIDITLCAGETFVWDGQNYTQSGVYTNTYIAADGSDSIVTLNLNILPDVPIVTIDATICHGGVFVWHGVSYDTTGSYTTILTNVNGCDSVVILNLLVLPEVPTTIIDTILCYGLSLEWRGLSYDVSGTYPTTLTNIDGCDSIIMLDLTILPDVIMEKESYIIGNNQLPYTWRGTDYSTAGQYTLVEQYANTLCDSVIHVLDLTVLTTGAIVETDTIICEATLPYLWHDQSLTTSGQYTHVEKYIGTDIDSVQHILNLFVMPTTYATEEATIIDGETFWWNGVGYDRAGEYKDTLQTINGCDSIITLLLNVLDNSIIVNSVQPVVQCADEGVVEITIDVEGRVDSLGLQFAPDSLTLLYSGLHDTIVPMPIDGHLLISFPHIRAGVYDVTLVGYFCRNVVFSQQVELTYFYPSTVLEQRWDDVICVLTSGYNGGYDFVAFQWYKDGQELLGENRSYLSQPLEMGSEYSALLTEINGTQLMTCPIIAVEHADVMLYPTFVDRMQQMRCHLSMDAQIYLYDTMGKLCMEIPLYQGENYFHAPHTAGIYMAKIILLTGEERNVKLLVM